jgi:hypothetical protein
MQDVSFKGALAQYPAADSDDVKAHSSAASLLWTVTALPRLSLQLFDRISEQASGFASFWPWEAASKAFRE